MLIGWTITAAVSLYLLSSAATKFLGTAATLAEFEHLGYPRSVIFPVAFTQMLGILLYLMPRTGTLGAVLITAYMGGGAAIHLRAGDPVIIPIATAVLTWIGLILRDPRVRSVMPWRTQLTHPVPDGTPSHRSPEI